LSGTRRALAALAAVLALAGCGRGTGGYPRVKAEQLPMTLGRDVAGAVDKVGPGVAEEVYATLPPERGGYAEFVTVKASDCTRRPGRTDAVQAAAGGVGHLAVQFGRAKGAIVIATARAEDREFLKDLGVVQVIDYKSERFEHEVPKVDMVFDLMNGETQDRSWSVLKDGGALISTLRAPDPARAAEHHARTAHYMAQPNGRELEEIARPIDSGQVTPRVERTYPLEAAGEAERALEQEHVRGKIVLRL
jgi:NADPH:quinone reductase-like Zn-dependent oxidoreductase